MMDARLGWLSLGGCIGFILGYAVRALHSRQAKAGVPNDGGFFDTDRLNRIGLFLVVALVAISAFFSQQSSTTVAHQQTYLDKNATCNQSFLKSLLSAVNARTIYSEQQAHANLVLQGAQENFLVTLFSDPPTNDPAIKKAIATYLAALETYTTFTEKASVQSQKNPYPTATDFSDCIADN